ncbi:MAG: hypothetical protein PHX46_02575 [Bacilli bacterium]|nr:hypothetical protein [Bacilli bacterium]
MNKEHKQNEKNDFPQNTMISLVFPFSTLNSNINTIKQNLLDKNFTNDEQFIDDDSRHFDHIEQMFLYKANKVLVSNEDEFTTEKINCSTEPNNYAFSIDKNNNNFSKVFKFENNSNIEIEKFFSIENLKFILFETGIFFLIIKYKSCIIHKYEEYFEIILKLRDYYKQTKILDFVETITGLQKKQTETFDMDKEQGTTRFQMFSEVVLGHEDNKKYRHSKNDYEYLNENETNILANYFLNRNSVANYIHFPPDKIPYTSAFYGNKVFCTEEGVLSLTTKYSCNIKLYNKTYEGKNEPFIQNVFYSYIIILHQYYFLHYLKKKIKKLNIYDKKIKENLISIKEEYVLFQTNYIYKKVSQFYYQEKIYQLFLNTLSIDNFSKEIENSTKPLDEILKEKRNEKLDLIVKFFTAITITNAFCSLLGAYYVFFDEGKIDKFHVVGIPTILLFGIYIFLIYFCKKNVKQIKKAKINRNK